MTQYTTTRDFTATIVVQQEEEEEEEKEDAAAAAAAAAAAEDSTDAQNAEDASGSDSSNPWHLFGTACPKEEIVFLCQVLILFTVILVSIYNLTTGHENSNLWTALLSSSLCYLLPNPTLRRNGDWFLPDIA